MKRLLLLAVFLLLSVGFAFTIDYGGTIEEKIEADDELFKNTLSLAPWFSWNINDDLYIYLSGILSVNYDNYAHDLPEYDGWAVVPELSLFMVGYRFTENMSVEAGRIKYTDILDFTASGLFDGVNLKMPTPFGNLDAGMYYTGLLYKETAKVVMTSEDAYDYIIPWNSRTNSNYFASRRLFFTGRLDMPFPFSEAVNFSTELLLQFDVNSNEYKIHSQYLQAKVDYNLQSMTRLTGGVLIETMESDHGDAGAALGLLAQVKTALSATEFNDFVGFTLKFTSGATGDSFPSFAPITSTPQGNVFSQALAGLLLISADYSARIIESLYAEAALRYFIRTYKDIKTSGYLYGAEIWTFAAWRPYEDVRVTLGTGLFFPQLGNVYPSDADIMWKVTLGLAMFL
jgi:hypothetical protein